MLVMKYVDKTPSWTTKSQPITISKLLVTLSNTCVHHVSVRLLHADESAYVAIAFKIDNPSSNKMLFFSIHRQLWLVIEHMFYTESSKCNCWCCRWRNKYRRYTSPKDFVHVMKPHDSH